MRVMACGNNVLLFRDNVFSPCDNVLLLCGNVLDNVGQDERGVRAVLGGAQRVGAVRLHVQTCTESGRVVPRKEWPAHVTAQAWIDLYGAGLTCTESGRVVRRKESGARQSRVELYCASERIPGAVAACVT
eukprot:2879572-Rhodomonas_salina.1